MSRPIARTPVKKIILDMAATNITAGAWVQLVASMDHPISAIQVFNGSGSVLKLSKGATAAEDAGELLCYIFPGMNVLTPVEVANLKKLSVRSADITADQGTLAINCFG